MSLETLPVALRHPPSAKTKGGFFAHRTEYVSLSYTLNRMSDYKAR